MNKIVFTSENTHTMNGLAMTLQMLGEDVIIWDTRKKPVFDLFHEIRPDYIFISGQSIGQDIVEALNRYPDIKVVLGGINCNPSVNLSCILVPTGLDRQIIGNLPDVPKYEMTIAANYAGINNVVKNHRMETEIGYVSNLQEELPGEIIDALENAGYSFKMIGPRHMGYTSYLGYADINTCMEFAKSCQVVIDYNGYSKYDYAANKIFSIDSEQVEDVDIFLHKDSGKLKYDLVKRAHKEVMEKHTYFHRVKDLGNLLEEPTWQKATKTLEKIKK